MWCLYEAFQEHEEKPEGRLLMLGVCAGNFNYLDRLFFGVQNIIYTLLCY